MRVKRKRLYVRFPHMKARAEARADPGQQMETGQVDTSGAKGKVQGKAHKFGIHFPKSKHTKSAPQVSVHPPEMDFRLPQDGDQAEEHGKGNAKLRMPKFKLPKIRLSQHSDDLEGDLNVKREIKISPPPHVTVSAGESGAASEVQPGVEVSVTKVSGAVDVQAPDLSLNIAGQRVSDEVEGTVKSPKFSMPKIELSDEKLARADVALQADTVDIDIGHYVGGDGQFKLPDFDVTPPTLKTTIDMQEKGTVTLPKVDMTNVEVKKNTWKTEYNEFEVTGGQAEFKMKSDLQYEGSVSEPSLDISPPNISITSKEKGVHIHGPTSEVSIPEVKSDINVQIPEFECGKSTAPSIEIVLPETGLMEYNEEQNTEVLLPKTEIEGDIKTSEGSLKIPNIPAIDVSIPKIDLDISVPKGKVKGPENDFEASKSGKVKLPDVDISLPKGSIEGALPSIDVSLPKGKLEGPDVDLEGSTGAKFKMPGIKMPKVDITLPKGKVEGPEIQQRCLKHM
ncbi:hypothetical protein WMY93_028196 [Mugilogobius chulae]|uniref:Uncharacterized protein n=1 Tax=Mugilogobius chulae TaxID=88201 RepID=A0AAW0MML4_9GOBI